MSSVERERLCRPDHRLVALRSSCMRRVRPPAGVLTILLDGLGSACRSGHTIDVVDGCRLGRIRLIVLRRMVDRLERAGVGRAKDRHWWLSLRVRVATVRRATDERLLVDGAEDILALVAVLNVGQGRSTLGGGESGRPC